MTTYKSGTVVGILDRRGEQLDAVIADTRIISRGRRAGQCQYELAPLTGRQGKAYGYKVTGQTFFKEPSREYSEQEIEGALKAYRGTSERVQETKQEKRRVSWERLKALRVQPGDEVLVRYKDAPPKWETVVKTNATSGRIAIGASTTWSVAGIDRASTWTKVRWIDNRVVIQSRKPQAKLPFTLTDAHLETLAEKGWVQVRFGREFIESSYVVAFTPEDARKGQNYEVADKTVNQDAELKVYWRRTGSFD